MTVVSATADGPCGVVFPAIQVTQPDVLLEANGKPNGKNYAVEPQQQQGQEAEANTVAAFDSWTNPCRKFYVAFLLLPHRDPCSYRQIRLHDVSSTIKLVLLVPLNNNFV